MQAPGGKLERILLVFTSLYLAGTFVRRLYPISESPGPTEKWLSLVFELTLALSVVFLGVRVLRTVPQQAAGRLGWIALMVAGIIGAVGIFGIRLSGGPRVELPPRPGQSAARASMFPPELEKLGVRMGEVMTAYQKAETAAQDSRWAKTDPGEYRKLPREALKEYIARLRELVDATDRAIEMLAQPGFEADVARMLSIAEARGERVPKGDLKPDALRLLRRIYAGSHQVHLIVDANWEEWLANPTPGSDLKPWQKEMQALVSDIQIADKEHDALVEARASAGGVAKPNPEPPKVDFTKLETELKAVHAAFKTRWDKLLETRWAQTESNDPREGRNCSFATIIVGAIPQLRKLSREDLREFREAQAALLDSYAQTFSLFQEAQTKGFDPFNPGVGLGGWYRNIASWRAAHRAHAIAYAQSELLEQNWESWRREGIPQKGKAKPWHKKAQELQGEFDAALNAWTASR